MPRTRTYGLDKDTLDFAARVKAGSGTTLMSEPLKQINKFVVGLKKLRMWNDIICWPMRNIHNAGTGSILYSLGGGGINNGNMFNGPSWGYNGIFFGGNTSSHYITLPNNTISAGASDFSMGGVALVTRKTSGDTRNFLIAHDDGNSAMEGTVNIDSGFVELTETIAARITMSSTQLSRFIFLGSNIKDKTIYAWFNNSLIGSSSNFSANYNRTGTLITIGSGRLGSTSQYAKLNGTMSFAFVVKRSINVEISPFYSLYYKTIGQNLGLV